MFGRKKKESKEEPYVTKIRIRVERVRIWSMGFHVFISLAFEQRANYLREGNLCWETFRINRGARERLFLLKEGDEATITVDPYELVIYDCLIHSIGDEEVIEEALRTPAQPIESDKGR